MGNPDLRPYLDFAVEAATAAGRYTLQYFQTDTEVHTKDDASPVTAADRGAERLLRDLIGERYPDHAILGEEFGATGDPGASMRWILDPVDGTKAFVHGVPLFGTLVALEIEGTPAVGVAYLPVLDELVAAATGLGASWNGRPCHVARTERLSDALLCFTSMGAWEAEGQVEALQRLRGAVARDRGWSDLYGFVLVATGRVDLAVEPFLNPWDCAPYLPILAEAGGCFTDWTGEATCYGQGGIATNPRLLEQVLPLLGARGDRAAG